MPKVKLIISDEPEEIIIQYGLNLNKFKKKIPHLLIRYVLSFLTTKQKNEYGRLRYECDWSYKLWRIFQITFKSKYLPTIIRNFEIANWNSIRCALKSKGYANNLDYKSKTKFIQSIKDYESYDKSKALKLLIISGILAKPFPNNKICKDCERSKYSEQDYIKYCVRQGFIKCYCDGSGVVDLIGWKSYACDCRFAKKNFSKLSGCDCDSNDKN